MAKAHNPAYATLRDGAAARYRTYDGIMVRAQAFDDKVVYSTATGESMTETGPLFVAGGYVNRRITGPYHN